MLRQTAENSVAANANQASGGGICASARISSIGIAYGGIV